MRVDSPIPRRTTKETKKRSIATTARRRRRRRSMSRVPRVSRIRRRSRTNEVRMWLKSARIDNQLRHTLRNGGATVSTGERKERRGFASMSPEKQREIASKGGRAAHEKGTAHEWTADEARSAGRKGGQVSRGGRGRLIVPEGQPNPTPGTEGSL